MQTNREPKGHSSKSHLLKRLRSATKYPRKEPAFIIGFAMQETYDNLVTAQQKICGSTSPKSPQGSDHTITPKGSTCSYTTAEIDENQHDLALPKMPFNNAGCDRDEGGDIEVKLPSLEECIIIKNIEENRMIRTEQDSSEPELIFKTSGHRRRLKQRTSKKQNKCKHSNKVKTVYNKRKDLKIINKKISKYLGGNHITLNKMQSKSISKMLSKSRILKKVSAKESLIEDQHLKGMNDKDSITASFITANESYFSYSSQDTLTFKESNSDANGSDIDLPKTESANSVIRILPDEAFNTVINVSRAMIQSSTFGVEHNARAVPSNSTIVVQNLTSTETMIYPVALTSDPVSEVSSKFICDDYMNPNISDISTERLTEGERVSTTTEASDEEDTFYNAKTSSYFKKSDHESNPECAIQMERPDVFVKETFAKADPYPANSALIDTVINLSMFPEIASHSSNDVIVTGNLNNIYTQPKEEQTLGYDQIDVDRIIPKNIAQKSFCPELKVNYIKPKTDLNFVNETAITDILQGNGKHDNVTRTVELSANNHPLNLSELWEKLLLALDSTAKKIEESISEKIIKEMRVTLSILNKSNDIKDVEASLAPPAVNNSGDTEVSTKVVCPDEAPRKLEQGLQCSLVQSIQIDELMFFKKSGKISHQSNAEFLEHCVEVLKPPGVLIPDRGDVVTLTDDETVAGPSTKFQDKTCPQYLRLPIILRFLKENVFVLTGVPIFFGVFIVFYVVVVIIVQLF